MPGSVYPLTITQHAQQVQGVFSSKTWAQHGSAPAMRIGGVAAFALRLALGPCTWLPRLRGLDDGAKFKEGTQDIRMRYQQQVSANSKLITSGASHPCDNMHGHDTSAVLGFTHRPQGLKLLMHSGRFKCVIRGYLTKT